MRTDDNNNPAAITCTVAKQAGLKLGVDYAEGTLFPSPSKLITAKLLGDPILLTIRVIDALGYFTKAGDQRWEYIAIPYFVWESLSLNEKRDVIGYHYQQEGGTKLRRLFPNYGRK